MNLKPYIAMAVLILGLVSAPAQTKVKVLTRVTEKSYAFSEEFLLDIDAEKADITIETIPGDSLYFILKQIVKNTNLNIAEKHLKAQKFSENKSRERLFLKNYILFDGPNENSGSIFKNEYIIKVPSNCHVRVKNSLGNTVLTNLKKTALVNVTYGKVEVNELNGKLDANVSLGELTINQGMINGTIEAKNTVVKLQNPSGNITGKLEFGSLSLFLNGNPLITELLTSYCETTIINKSEGSYAFVLESVGGRINAMEHKVSKTGTNETLIIKPEADGVLPEITIRATNNAINLY